MDKLQREKTNCPRANAANAGSALWHAKLFVGVVAMSARASKAGWTLLEMLIAAGISSILVASIAALSLYGARSFAVIGNFADMDADSRQALDLLSREFRQATGVWDWGTNLPVRWISVTTNGFGPTAKVTWDSQLRTVTLTARGHDRLLLEECDFWDLKLYQRVPVISATNVAFSGSAGTN